MKKNPKHKEAVKTYKGATALLLGNGINRSPNSGSDRYEWGNLLEDLNSEFAKGRISRIREKPFPMAYDEITSYAVKNNRSEFDLKESIKAKIKKLEANDRYQLLDTNLYSEILTTNYDYLIEEKLDPHWKRKPITRDEYYYSIFRNQSSSQKQVWHIHGEQADKRSILLGFRHYLNYTSKVKERAENTIQKITSSEKITKASWVDIFFSHNIELIGLGMEVTEYPLWWLLAYRHYISTVNDRIDVDNEVTYIMPAFNSYKKCNIIDMLKAYGVKIKELGSSDGDYDQFYEELLDYNMNKTREI